MTLSQSMLCTAQRAAHGLGPFAAQVSDYIKRCSVPEGGFRGRGEGGDLYYTAFALDCLSALSHPLPLKTAARFVALMGDGADLDLVHLACLARCWMRLSMDPPPSSRRRLAARVDGCRCPQGGHATRRDARHASVAGTFLAVQALEDLGLPSAYGNRIDGVLKQLRTGDGAYANEPHMETGSTPATAGAAVLMTREGFPVPDAVVEWLLARLDASGGFLASPGAPMPDLLSTATALFALRTLKAPLDDFRASCAAFVEGLQAESGGFCGHWMDAAPDCEYTFYAMLSLGCLTP